MTDNDLGDEAGQSAAKEQPRARVVNLDDVEYFRPLPGQRCRPILGENMLANVVYFEAHAEAPVHTHVEEQIVVVLEGEIDYEIDGKVRTLRRGDIAMIPPWSPHGGRTGDEPCVELEIFSPPREPLLDAARSERLRLAASE